VTRALPAAEITVGEAHMRRGRTPNWRARGWPSANWEAQLPVIWRGIERATFIPR